MGCQNIGKTDFLLWNAVCSYLQLCRLKVWILIKHNVRHRCQLVKCVWMIGSVESGGHCHNPPHSTVANATHRNFLRYSSMLSISKVADMRLVWTLTGDKTPHRPERLELPLLSDYNKHPFGKVPPSLLNLHQKHCMCTFPEPRENFKKKRNNPEAFADKE